MSRKFLKTINTGIVSADTNGQLMYLTEPEKVVMITGINGENFQEMIHGYSVNSASQDKKTLHCQILINHLKPAQELCRQINTTIQEAGFIKVHCKKARFQHPKPIVSGILGIK